MTECLYRTRGFCPIYVCRLAGGILILSGSILSIGRFCPFTVCCVTMQNRTSKQKRSWPQISGTEELLWMGVICQLSVPWQLRNDYFYTPTRFWPKNREGRYFCTLFTASYAVRIVGQVLLLQHDSVIRVWGSHEHEVQRR